jgi:transcriptional regulator with AAA-type ATPase domain
VSTASTLLEQGSDKGSSEQGFHLLVLALDLCTSHPLPATGTVVIGRGKDADLVIDDPLASRRHVRLHLEGGALQIEDLASANGTRLREQKLPRDQRVPLLPGEAVGIGKTILMVLPNRPPTARRVLLSHDEFIGRVEWECARAEATGNGFTIVRVQSAETDAAASALATTLRRLDLLASYGPGHYEVLLPGVAGEAGAAMAQALGQSLTAAGLPSRFGLAVYPVDGRHANALLACAAARLLPAAVAKVPRETGATSAAMQQVLDLARRAAAGTINVLILGETGAGKEVLARFIHAHSARAQSPFVCIDCAALSASLLESELFGHERGAFTGATAAKPGLLETAPGGTVFLDEVGELPLPLQAKLLRAIENRTVTRVGGVKARAIDVRFLAATNRDLEAATASGDFRSDLYYRLNGMTLTVPPLRERIDDIPRLASTFVAELCGNRRPPALGDDALRLLCGYGWPGNVRELRNVIERALLLCDGAELTVAHLPQATLARQPLSRPSESQPLSERERILTTLAACGGNQSRAARELGLSRKVLIARLASYGAARPRKSAHK